LHRALEGTRVVLGRVRPKDLDGPTPCASWDVRGLINHFVGTTRWWAATIAGDGVADLDYAAGDYVAAYEESIRIAVTAFGADGAMDRTIQLPFGEFPGAVLLSLGTMEQFMPGWDLPRATGQSTDLDPGLAAGLLSQARLAIPDAYSGPDGLALFGAAREAPAMAGPADQLAAFLGRIV
jgi:uncharacterized protein (TIGR03086 family)